MGMDRIMKSKIREHIDLCHRCGVGWGTDSCISQDDGTLSACHDENAHGMSLVPQFEIRMLLSSLFRIRTYTCAHRHTDV